MRSDAEVCVIVVNWNGARLLPTCLDALRSQTRPVEILVVDNGSTDASAAVVAAREGVRWLALGENRGFAEGNNAGLRVALAEGARWVALVNTDVVLAPDWIARTVAAAEAHPEAGLFNGLLVFGDDPDRVNSTGIVLDRLGRAFDRDFGAPVASLARADGPVDAITGGAVLVTADALRRVGLLDPGYFAYYEDVDLSLRAAKAGIGCRYVSGALAVHGYGKTIGRDAPRKRYLLARNHLRCAARNLPLARALPLVLALPVLRAAVRAPLELARGRPAHAAAQLRGAVDGAVQGVAALAARFRAQTATTGGSGAAPWSAR
jgi:GT2 family glycosyltransferase